MADQWFIVRDEKKYGPYTLSQMKQFAASGNLLPIDMVSQTGTDPWVPASQVEAIFPATALSSPVPPPVARQPASVQGHNPAADKVGELWRRVWGNKLLFFGLCLGCSLFLCCPLHLAIDPFLPKRLHLPFRWLFLLFNVALVIAFLCAWMAVATAHTERKKRRGHLHGLWEPVDQEGQSFLFTKDGGMYRSDGFGAKYRWAADDKLELYEEGCEQTVQFTLLSLSELEMILKTGGQSCHFKRSQTITEAEMCRRREAALQALASAGRVAANVAGGVAKVAVGAAAVLAVGGFAVLCGAAASSGPGAGSGNMVACWLCDQTGTVPAGTCPRCGGKGWLLA